MKTTATLALIRHIAALEYGALTHDDAMAFADAQVDALIAWADSDIAPLICDLEGGPATVLTEGGPECVAVIISGERLELHGVEADANPFCVSLQLQADAI